MTLRRAGFGLAEVLFAVAAITLALTGLVKMLTGMNRNIAGRRTIATRNSVFDSLESYAQTPALLKSSLALNAATSQFVICVNGTGGPNGCTATITNPTSFACLNGTGPAGCLDALVYPSTLNLADDTGQLAAGLATAPVFYDIKGKKCAAIDNQNCIYEARARFFAVCPGALPGPATCAQASQIVTSVEYKAAATVQNLTTTNSHAGKRKVSQRVHSVFVVDILGTSTGRSCNPTTEYMTGVDLYGNPVCAALPPIPSPPTYSDCGPNQIQNGNQPNGAPSCMALNIGQGTCHAPNFMVGLNADGSPNCAGTLYKYQRCVSGTGGLPFMSTDPNCENPPVAGPPNSLQGPDFLYAVNPAQVY
jgi:hypothetical protein